MTLHVLFFNVLVEAMDAAWNNWEGVYEHTLPTLRARTPVYATPPEGTATYRLEGQPDSKRPRCIIVLQSAGTVSSVVPALIQDASSWRSFSAPSQGSLTPEMIVVADMLYTSGPQLAEELNTALAARGLPPRRFVSNVIEKAQDPDTSAAQRANLLAALEATLRPYMPPVASLEMLMAQWMTAVVWMDKHTVCAHPLRARLEKEGGAAELCTPAAS